jgi:hypothetical protein
LRPRTPAAPTSVSIPSSSPVRADGSVLPDAEAPIGEAPCTLAPIAALDRDARLLLGGGSAPLDGQARAERRAANEPASNRRRGAVARPAAVLR